MIEHNTFTRATTAFKDDVTVLMNFMASTCETGLLVKSLISWVTGFYRSHVNQL